ncbi:unannotated protein [freshwater metagenome]|uniref:Unannotated protein n=1 Tax=freshwater metagenome TaxID=449393 RepID=A0A6J6YC26_9ZZZZ
MPYEPLYLGDDINYATKFGIADVLYGASVCPEGLYLHPRSSSICAVCDVVVVDDVIWSPNGVGSCHYYAAHFHIGEHFLYKYVVVWAPCSVRLEDLIYRTPEGFSLARNI